MRLKRLARCLIGVKDLALLSPVEGEIEYLECDACDRKSVAC